MTDVLDHPPVGEHEVPGDRSRTSRTSSSRRSRRWPFLGLAVLLASVWGLLGYRAAADAREDADLGRQKLLALDGLGLTTVTNGELGADLQQARGHLTDAQGHLQSFWLVPGRWIPGVRTQLTSVEALNGAALETIDVGLVAAEEAQQILESPPTTGPERVEVLERVKQVLDQTSATLSTLDLGPEDGLVSELDGARRSFDEQRAELLERLDQVSDPLGSAIEIVKGPRRYVLVAANNAEMRAGSGMALFSGILTIEDGDFRIDEMQSTSDLGDSLQGPIPLNDADLAYVWGHAGPGHDFRNLGLTPRFAVSADIGTRFWEEAVGGEDVDGMLMVDPVAISDLIDVTGPIRIDGLELDRAKTVSYLLRDQYLDPRFEKWDTDAQYLEIVNALTTTLSTTAFDPLELAGALEKSAQGRHILGWSRIESDQALWQRAGIDGALSENSFGLAIQNAGGNKLDYGLDVSADIDIRPGSATGGTEVVVNLQVANPDPTLGMPYPPVQGFDAEDGDYIGVLAVTLPADAREVVVRGAGPIVRGSTDGPAQVVTTDRFMIRGGETAFVEIRFVVPSNIDEIAIESSARVPAITYTVGEKTVKDVKQRVLDLSPSKASIK